MSTFTQTTDPPPHRADRRAAPAPAAAPHPTHCSPRASSNGLAVVAAVYTLMPVSWLLIAAPRTTATCSAPPLPLATFNLFANLHTFFTFNDGIYLRWFGNSICTRSSARPLDVPVHRHRLRSTSTTSRGKEKLFGLVLGGVRGPHHGDPAADVPARHQGRRREHLLGAAAARWSTRSASTSPRLLRGILPNEVLEALASTEQRAAHLRRYLAADARPGFMTIFLFSFTASWNNFFGALVMLNDEKLVPGQPGPVQWNSVTQQQPGVLLARHHRLARRVSAGRRFVLPPALLALGPDRRAVNDHARTGRHLLKARTDRPGTRPRTVLAMGREIHGSLLAEGALDRLRTAACVDTSSHYQDFTESADTELAAVEVLFHPLGRAADQPSTRCAACHGAGRRPRGVRQAPRHRIVWKRRYHVLLAAAANALPVAEFTLAHLFANKRSSTPPASTPRYATARAPPVLEGYGITTAPSESSRLPHRTPRRRDSAPATSSPSLHDPYVDQDDARALRVDSSTSTNSPAAACGVLPRTNSRDPAHVRRAPTARCCRTAHARQPARGSLVDTDALTGSSTVEAHPTPSRRDVNPTFYRPHRPVHAANVLLTPHIAGSSATELDRMAHWAVDEVHRYAQACRSPTQ